MKKTENVTAHLNSIISTLKKIEDNASVFAELGKISGELSSLNEYIQEGLQNIEFQHITIEDGLTQGEEVYLNPLAFIDEAQNEAIEQYETDKPAPDEPTSATSESAPTTPSTQTQTDNNAS